MRPETKAVVLEGLRGAAEYGTASAFKTGGISALALINKGFDVVLDRSAERFAEAGIYVSAGQRGDPEGPLALAEERTDEGGHEPGEVECVIDAGLAREVADVVSVVEGH